MLRKLFFLNLILAFSLNLNAQFENIKFDSTHCFVHEKGRWVKDNFNYYEFSKSNQKIKDSTVFYSVSEKIISTSTSYYFYDFSGKATVEKYISRGVNGVINYIAIDSFNYLNNNLFQTNYYEFNFQTNEYEFVYRTNNFVTEKLIDSSFTHYALTNQEQKTYYYYDSIKNLTLELSFYRIDNQSQWTPLFKTEYLYDQQGELISIREQEIMNGVVSEDSKLELIKDSHGNFLRANQYLLEDDEWILVLYCDLFLRKLSDIIDLKKNTLKLLKIGNQLKLLNANYLDGPYQWNCYDLQGNLIFQESSSYPSLDLLKIPYSAFNIVNVIDRKKNRIALKVFR